MARNWIQINQIPSTDIPGLIVQELPPIVRPAQKREETDVQGKDGNITTLLGYNTYTVVAKIGLMPGCNLDNITAWLKDQGEITFSHTPDRKQKYVLGQTDYTRLATAREADIEFTLQPLKYPTSEPPLNYRSTNLLDTFAITVPSDQTDYFHITGQGVLDPGQIQINVLRNFTGGRFWGTTTITGLTVGETYTITGAGNTDVQRIFIYTDQLWGTQIATGKLDPGVTFTAPQDNVVIGFYISGTYTANYAFQLSDLAFNTGQSFTPYGLMQITNTGNIPARPTIEITSPGQYLIDINSNTLMIDVPDGGMIIDCEARQVYANQAHTEYLNRQVIGDLSAITIPPGTIEINVPTGLTGTLSQYTRWI